MQYVAHYNLRPENFQLGAANSLYAGARGRGRRGQFWSLLTGRSRCLLALAGVKAARGVDARFDAGIRAVPLDQIRGSEDRVGDFDCDFYPLHDHNRERWLSVALARQQGKELPPVALVQAGDVYFVRDGHHRVSVARALRQKDIEARVIVWQVEG
jgi:hypothetical protein